MKPTINPALALQIYTFAATLDSWISSFTLPGEVPDDVRIKARELND